MPEHAVIKPVFFGDQLYGFVANIAHVTEIGGKAVGGFAADAREVYQEGLRLPPIKIVDRGRLVTDLLALSKVAESDCVRRLQPLLPVVEQAVQQLRLVPHEDWFKPELTRKLYDLAQPIQK